MKGHTMETQEKLLKAGAALVIGFGGVVWLGVHPATAQLPAFFGDLIFWPLDGLQSLDSDAAKLLSAITGGIMVGWGAMLWALAGDGMRLMPVFSKRVILVSISAWFCVDSLGSYLAGAPLNIIGNLVFLGLFTLPFLARRSENTATPVEG